MEIILALGIGILVASGVWLLLRPRTFQVILGLSMLSYAVNLFIYAMGRLAVDAPPLVGSGTPDPALYDDPLPQALVLTAIVIGFALSVILASLVLRAWRGHGTLRSDEIHSAERLGDPMAEPSSDAR